MPIALGLIALCIIFVLFGSKTEEASVLYYDMEEEGASAPEAAPADPETFADAPAEVPAPKPRRSAPSAGSNEAADIANSIYNDITL